MNISGIINDYWEYVRALDQFPALQKKNEHKTTQWRRKKNTGSIEQ